MKKEVFSTFDPVEYLNSEDEIAAYLDAAVEDGDPRVVMAAMGEVVRAKNVSKIARDAGLTREGVYKALSLDGNPSFATVWKVARALDLDLAFRARSPALVASKGSGKSGARGVRSSKTGRRTTGKASPLRDKRQA